MLRIFALLLLSGLFFPYASAQSSPGQRLTVQELEASDARILQESTELESFSQHLSALKAAFTDQNASRLIAYQSYLFNEMRNEVDQMREKAAGTTSFKAAPSSAIFLDKMTALFASFEEYSFERANPESAALHFIKLDEFLKVMQDELAEVKTAK